MEDSAVHEVTGRSAGIRKDVLRFMTCGSVDDGKSTLIGRLLYDSRNVFEDQFQALKKESPKYGSRTEGVDLAMLVDGLQAEREQGITIDVAYRFFATSERRFIVADTPGHEQYTRNMATAASTAELAVLLVDARKGILTQTKRHSRIAAMMGVSRVLLAVNKMDLVGFDRATFDDIVRQYGAFASDLGFASIDAVPVSGLLGDNILERSGAMPWYEGASLLRCLELVDAETSTPRHFRMPVQWVMRDHPNGRGHCGRIAGGHVRVGDVVQIAPSACRTRIGSIQKGFERVETAGVGDCVVLTFTEEMDAGRGAVIAAADCPIDANDQFEARMLWMHEHPMVPGRQYLLKLACSETTAIVTEIKFRVDINTGHRIAAKTIAMNEIAQVTLSANARIAFEPYTANRALGGFVLIDKSTFETVGAGIIDAALSDAHHLHWQTLEVSSVSRARQKYQNPQCLWFTGLSGAGKSTIANLLDKRLNAEGRHTYLLDGDNVRHGLNRDLGFTEADRVENIRRVAEVAKLMVDAGLIVLVSFISPYRSERQMARELFPPDAFKEIFVDTPLEECERRDSKGLYALARGGKLRNFTGIDSVYEAPLDPDIHVRTIDIGPDACVAKIMSMIGTGAADSVF
ncbi:adenylyl-sulfate kinase [Rhodopseudomonas sp. NSM]|uniref:adenylyl-sulfate kinase n=1 Tax=Rhodopseudomonas sp. NSM TaxID=3457630 RepID=UPI0040366758